GETAKRGGSDLRETITELANLGGSQRPVLGNSGIPGDLAERLCAVLTDLHVHVINLLVKGIRLVRLLVKVGARDVPLLRRDGTLLEVSENILDADREERTDLS